MDTFDEAVLGAWGICNVWRRMALPHALPQLQEHVGIKVMLCSVLVKLSAPGFCEVVSLLASLFSSCLFHSPVFIWAMYVGCSNMLACSFLRAVPSVLSEMPYQHLKLQVGSCDLKWSPCVLRSFDKELLIYMVLLWTQLRQSFPRAMITPALCIDTALLVVGRDGLLKILKWRVRNKLH